MRFDHIGVAVRDIESGRAAFRQLFQIVDWTDVFRDEINDVYVQFGLDSSGVCYELVAPMSAKSPVSLALAEKKNILAHLAFLVDDLCEAAAHLKACRALPAGPAKTAVAYGGSRIQFFYSTELNFIIELIETSRKHVYHRGSSSAETGGAAGVFNTLEFRGDETR